MRRRDPSPPLPSPAPLCTLVLYSGATRARSVAQPPHPLHTYGALLYKDPPSTAHTARQSLSIACPCVETGWRERVARRITTRSHLAPLSRNYADM